MVLSGVQEGPKINFKLLSEMHRYGVGICDFVRRKFSVVIVVSGSVICDSHMDLSEYLLAATRFLGHSLFS